MKENKIVFEYSVSTGTLWNSFDYGEVEAEDYDEALKLAKADLDAKFELANKALKDNPTTKGMSVHFADDQITIKVKK
jgi:hypothetical protein